MTHLNWIFGDLSYGLSIPPSRSSQCFRPVYDLPFQRSYPWYGLIHTFFKIYFEHLISSLMRKSPRRQSPRRASPSSRAEPTSGGDYLTAAVSAVEMTPFSSPLDSGMGHDKYLIFFYRPHFILAFLGGAGNSFCVVIGFISFRD